MDLLATSPSLLLLEPIAKTFTEFILLYKEVHKLKFVPLPTIEHKVFTGVLNKINGHEVRKTQIPKDPNKNTRDIFIASLAKSSLQTPRNHHCGESSHQASQHHRLAYNIKFDC